MLKLPSFFCMVCMYLLLPQVKEACIAVIKEPTVVTVPMCLFIMEAGNTGGLANG